MATRNAWPVWMSAIVLMVAGVAAPVWAEEKSSGRVNGMLRKLGRGIANVVTCPAELIRTPRQVGLKDGGIAESTVGVLQGAWRTVARGVAGVFEIGTFYVENPNGFEPIMLPEFVWVSGDWAE